MLCYRCGSHIKEGSDACVVCGQKLETGSSAFGTGTTNPRVADTSPYRVGDVIARRYAVQIELGEGPLGWVYKCLDVELDVGVAVKVLRSRLLQSEEELRAFERDLRAVSRVSHPNIVRVYEVGADADRTFFTMQHLEGLSLRRIIDARFQKGQAFAPSEVVPIIEQLAAALTAAESSLAHGDLKPENVIVLPDLLKITDFGLATSLPGAPFLAAQRSAGTHRYLAPEFLASERLDPRVDVFALGVLIGEMLAGTAYEGPSLDLRERQPGLSAGVEAVFRRATSAKGAARFASAAELAAEFSAAVGRAEVSPDAPRVERKPVPPPPPSTVDFVDDKYVLESRDLTPGPFDDDATPTATPTDRRRIQATPPSEREPKVIAPKPFVIPRSSTGTMRFGAAERPARRGPLAVTGAVIFLIAGLLWFLANGGSSERPTPAASSPMSALAAKVPPAPGNTDAGVITAVDAGVADAPKKSATESAPPVPESAKRLAAKPHAAVVSPSPAKAASDMATETKKPTVVVAHLPATSSEDPAPVVVKNPEPVAAPPGVAAVDAPPVPAGSHCPLGMRHVPAGDFVMGSAKGDDMRNFGERNAERVTTSAYCVDLYEFPNRPGMIPRVSVSQEEADASCRKLGKRLCDEREWERACKGPTNFRFPYADRYDGSVCNTQDATDNPRPLGVSGRFANCRSGYGVYDLSGNVGEWTSSPYDDGVPEIAVKGGNSARPGWDTRCASRTSRPPSARDSKLGFRCCADAQ